MAHAQTTEALRLREERCAELSERIVSLERGHEQQLHSMRGSFEDSVLGLQRNLEAFQRTATLAHNSENSDQERRLVDKLSTAHEELLRMTQENGELYVNLSVQKHELINLRSDLAALRQEHSGLVDEHSQLRDVFETVKEQRDAFRAASIHLSAAPTPSVEVRAHRNNNAGGGGGLFSQFSPIVHREASDDVSPKTSDTPVRNVSSNDNQQHQNNTSAQLLDVITATLQQHEARVLHEVDRIRQIAEARPTHAEGAAPSADDSVTSSLNALLMGPVGTTAPLPEAAEPSAHEVLRFALQTLNTVVSVLGVALPVNERLLSDTVVGESSVSNLFTHVAHLSRAVIHAAINEQRRMSALESGTSSSVDSLVTAFTSLTSDHSAQVLQSYQSWVGDSLTAVKDQVKDLCALLRSEQCIHAEKESQASRFFAQHFAPLRDSLVAFAQRHRAIAEEKDSALLMVAAYEEASKKQQDADHHKSLEPLHPVKQLAAASTQVTPEPTPQAHAATQTVQDASTETMPESVVVEHRSATPPTIQVAAIMMATTATNTDDVLPQPTASQKEDDAEYAAFLSKAHRILEEHQALSLEVDAVRASEEKAHASAQEWQRTSTELETMLDNECTLVSDLRGALTSLKSNMSDVQRYYAVQLALLSDQLHNVCQRCMKEEKRNATLHERCAAKEKRIGELIALTKVSSPPMRHSDTQSFHTTGRAHSSSVGQSNIRAPSSFLTSPSSQHGANSASSPVTRPIYFKQQRASSQSGHMRSLSRDWSPSGLSPSPVPGVLQ
ncbi:Hypothetical protein, putative [Bodo saltans]|uniref:Uncharacterized protein n=1 Tax=Bodo saltans TaxID=75058 RepID=A0A0S4IYX1_BODSA|nr:Hypothetical protein, putative [Bodo saltans]|eukprot:CUG24387.1 Hypothetical protein, putative [Bodo saltans]